MTSDRTTSVADLAAQVVDGVPAAIARAITWCETGDKRGEDLLAALSPRAAHVVGFTGAPGTGKSTLVTALLRRYRFDGDTVGVLAVDPSSPLSGGALLGDRVRLEGHDPGDRGTFFRSLASRGAAGGLSEATRAAATVLSAGGLTHVLVETVGAGQAEVEIMRVADTVALVLNPGSGDDIQAFKAGLMEIADVYVLNKADRPGAGELKAQVAAVLHARDTSSWRPPIVQTVASADTGVDDLVGALARHCSHLDEGTRGERRRTGIRAQVLRTAGQLFDRAARQEIDAVLAELSHDALTEPEAARRLAKRAARRMSTDDE